MQANMQSISPAKLVDIRNKFREGAVATGAWGVEQIRAKSAAEVFTESLQRQNVTFGKAIKQRALFNNVLAEQYRIQKMMAVQWSTSASGRMTADMIMPRGLDDGIRKINESWKENAKQMITARRGSLEFTQASDMMRMRLGLLNEVINSSANNMVKWGKNTQWAGRQLMVGFTVPLIAFGALAGKVAYDVDKQLTRIAKVYDTTADTMIGRQREIDEMRTRSTENAIQVARRYGSAIEDTLEVEAELAAAGLQGDELLRSTTEIQRISTLGELDKQQAVKMSIALQRAFNLSVEETSEKMNFMNAIENATSLSLQDFAEATPRAASAMASLGVTVEQMGVLLVAMKENGVEAAQGANALRSATARLIRPTKESTQVLKEMGIDIMAITNATGGNLFKSLEMLGAEFERLGLTSLQQRQAIAELFGTYQFNRLNAALQGVADRSGQVGRAFDVMNKSTSEWANTADREIGAITSSLSGRLSIAVQTIKAELSTMGEPFLRVGIWALNMASSIIKAFNEMPGGIKVALAAIIAFGAILGPIIMLVGLLANGIGMVIKGMGAFAGLFTRFRAVNAEQQAAALLAKESTRMWQDQAFAARTLAAEITKLSTAFQTNAQVAQQHMAAMGVTRRGPATSPVGGFYQSSAGALMVQGPGGRGMPATRGVAGGSATQRNAARAAAEDMAYAENEARNASAAVAANSGRAAAAWSRIATSVSALSLGAILMADMTGNSDKISGNFTSILMSVGLFAPMLVGAMKKVAAAGAFKELAGAFGGARTAARAGGAGRVGGMLAGVKGLAPAMSRFMPIFLRFAGPAGLVATALMGFIKIKGEMDDIRKVQEDINTSAKGWAEVLGFVYNEQVASNIEGGKQNSLLETRRAQLAKLKPGLVQELKSLHEANRMQALYNAAINEGVKARLHGASAAQAQQAVETALFAGGLTRSEIAELDLVINQINWENMDDVIEHTQNDFRRQWRIAANNAAGQGGGEGFLRLISGSRDELNTKTKAMIKGLAQEFWQTWKSQDMAARREYFDTFAEDIAAQNQRVFNQIDKDSKRMLEQAGITPGALVQSMNNGVQSAQMAMRFNLSDDELNSLKMAAEAERAYAIEIAKSNNLTDEQIKNINTMNDLIPYLDMNQRAAGQTLLTVADAQDAYANAMMRASITNADMNDKEKLRLLNFYRMQAGLTRAKSLEEGFGGAVTNSADAVEDATGKIKDNTKATQEWAAAQTDAIRGAMGTAWGDVMDAAMDQYESQQQAQMDQLDRDSEALSNRHEREQDKFSSRWDAIYDRFDNRWDKRMAKEKAAEDNREKMFQAEKARIERLRDMENANIDFNSALNRGELDEAARIQANMGAQAEIWGQEDAESIAGSAAERRAEALQKVRDAERAALDERREAEEKALEEQQEREKKRIENARRAAEKISEINRKALERDLRKAQEFVPRNAAEVRKYVATLEEVYAKHGVRLDTTSQEWADMVTGAIRSSVAAGQEALAQDAKWEKIGEKAANAAVSVFGMDIKGFMKWIRTGELPKGAEAPSEASVNKASRRGALNRVNAMPSESRHTGGIIGSGGGSRRGYSGSQMPGEVTINALRGEAILNKKAARMLGEDGVQNLNDGKGVGGLGLVGVIGAGIGAMMRNMVQKSTMTQGIDNIRKLAGMSGPSFSAAAAGVYGDTSFDADQLANATTIMNVGRNMGASPRDLQIALMTAMQESMLRNLNYGHLDSLGLFQQRPSMGWGTPEQITNPEYAARQFFERLLAIKDRGSMRMTEAAQAVQRSAYPEAYAKWEDEAKAILNASQMTGQADGRFLKPVIPMQINRDFATHGRKGVDIGGTPGQPVMAVAPGRVITSAAIRGTNIYDNDGYASYGEYVVVDHGGMTSLYAHMLQNSRRVRTGESVFPGQILGSLGSTGNSSGPHLHFETRVNGNMVDPGQIGIPGLKVGGQIKYDNTIANLHKKETVLTAPLSSSLERGIDKMDKGGYNGDTYQFNFDGAVFQKDIDVEAAIEKVLRKRDSRMGRQRTIN